jgi:2-polyprenyl-3-methyl-5-hydroxy-6-metoxy-1,4-benzoquinol methylase
MEKLNTCLVCGQSQFSTLFTCKDFVASGEVFQIQRCDNCSFLFTNPRPEIKEIGSYYQSDRYISHSGNKKGLMYILYDIVRNYSIKKKLNLIKRFNSTGKLMDLGCGLGDFLYGAHHDGVFDCVGVDISEDAIKNVKNKFGLDVLKENQLDSFPQNSFDVITQWHVLEHVQLLNERIIQLKRLLKQGGTLFIAVPNSNSWDAKLYKRFWDAYDVPRHLYHFNQESFKLLMEKHDLKVIETHPLLFDAPYVSMRSERHKNHLFPFLGGGIIGAISNIMAKKNNDYSSLLFVVKNA